jgi:NTP pyrophosphatase (non-canonical NTP hydrolase)
MDFNEYTNKAKETAIYPETQAIDYCLLGLASEVGEVLGVRKKAIRDAIPFYQERAKISDELGDVFWYLSRILYHYELDFEQILENNITKLQSRKERCTLKGDGDDR